MWSKFISNPYVLLLSNFLIFSIVGCEAVLGPPQPVTHRLTEEGVPLEQAVSRQRLRPGSGFLAVNVLTDGPTRVLEITDIKQKVLLAVLETLW